MTDADAALWSPVRSFQRALVVVAHPDDAEFGAAGTVARWVEMGTDVRYVVLTDGASGSSDPAMTVERLAEIRRHRPEAVITLNPDLRWSSWGYVNHPDHRAVGDLVLHAINPAASTRHHLPAQARRAAAPRLAAQGLGPGAPPPGVAGRHRRPSGGRAGRSVHGPAPPRPRRGCRDVSNLNPKCGTLTLRSLTPPSIDGWRQ